MEEGTGDFKGLDESDDGSRFGFVFFIGFIFFLRIVFLFLFLISLGFFFFLLRLGWGGFATDLNLVTAQGLGMENELPVLTGSTLDVISVEGKGIAPAQVGQVIDKVFDLGVVEVFAFDFSFSAPCPVLVGEGYGFDYGRQGGIGDFKLLDTVLLEMLEDVVLGPVVVVVIDIEPGEVVVGVPARPIK